MTLPELCIRRPVMTTLLMVTFVVVGIFGYRLLPVAALPSVDFPTINVSASLPGASAELHCELDAARCSFDIRSESASIARGVLEWTS